MNLRLLQRDFEQQAKAWVCGCSLVGTAGSNPAGAWIVFLRVLCVVQVEVFASGRSPVQRIPTDSCVCVCVAECAQGQQ